MLNFCFYLTTPVGIICNKKMIKCWKSEHELWRETTCPLTIINQTGAWLSQQLWMYLTTREHEKWFFSNQLIPDLFGRQNSKERKQKKQLNARRADSTEESYEGKINQEAARKWSHHNREHQQNQISCYEPRNSNWRTDTKICSGLGRETKGDAANFVGTWFYQQKQPQPILHWWQERCIWYPLTSNKPRTDFKEEESLL